MTCVSCGTVLVAAAAFCHRCGTPAVAPTGGGPVERRVVTVLFGDLSDFTAWAETLDPERVGRLTDRVLRVMAQVVVAFGGHVDKLTGDGIMAVFGAPVAHEDDAERAVRSAVAMQRAVRDVMSEEIGAGQRLGLHVGLNTGEVLAGVQAQLAYTVVGDAVNTASRLADAAHAGEVLAGRSTVAAARGCAVWRRMPQLALKGKLEPVTAFQLVSVQRAGDVAALGWDVDAVSGESPVTGENRPRTQVRAGDVAPFVDRVPELRWLEAQFRVATESGEPVLAVLSGDAGIGKTRLVAEFARRVADVPGTLVVRGQCPPYGAERDVAPLVDVVRELCGLSDETEPVAAALRLRRTVERLREAHPGQAVDSDLVPRLLSMLGLQQDESTPEIPSAVAAESAAPGATRPGDAEAAESLLRLVAQDGPVVVVLDDAQWMSPGLAESSWRLARRVSGPILFLIVTRQDVPEALRELSARVERMPGRGLARLDLGALADEHVDALLELTLGGPVSEDTSAALRSRVAGNPFFLAEVVTMLAEQGMIDSRDDVWTVSGEIERLVPSGVRAVLASRIDQLPSEARTVLRDSSVAGGRVTVPALIALAQGRVADVRVGLRELVERGLLRATEGDTYGFANALTQEVAYAGIPKAERARRHVRLARWAAGRAGVIDTVDRSTWAAPEDEAYEADVAAALRVSDALVATHAQRALTLAAEIGMSENDVVEALRDAAVPAFSRLGARALARGAAPEALESLERVDQLTCGRMPAVARLNRAWALAEVGRRSDARREASALTDEEDPAVRAGAHLVLSTLAQRQGDRWVAIAHANQALAVASNASSAVEAGEALRRLGMLQFFSGQLAESETTFGEALALAESTGDTRGLGWTLQHMAWTLTMRGDFEAAGDVLAWAEATFEELGDGGGLAWVEGTRSMVLLLQGRFLEAWATASRVVAPDAGGTVQDPGREPRSGRGPGPWSVTAVLPNGLAVNDRWGAAVLLAVRSLAASSLGLSEEAEADARQALTLVRAVNDGWGEALALVALGRTAITARDLDAAATTFEQALQISVQRRAVFTGILALGMLGYVNILQGSPELAEARARRALDILGRADVEPPVRDSIRALLAVSRAMSGSLDEALEILGGLYTGGSSGVLLPESRVRAHIAEALLSAGRWAEAREWAEAALRATTEDHEAAEMARGVLAAVRTADGPPEAAPSAGGLSAGAVGEALAVEDDDGLAVEPDPAA